MKIEEILKLRWFMKLKPDPVIPSNIENAAIWLVSFFLIQMKIEEILKLRWFMKLKPDPIYDRNI